MTDAHSGKPRKVLTAQELLFGNYSSVNKTTFPPDNLKSIYRSSSEVISR